MPLSTQEHILKLAAECPSVQAVAVFRDRKWTSSSDVLDALSDASCRVSLCPTASPSAHLALRCLCCGCSPQASGSSRHRSKCRCTCRASGIRRGRSEDAVCASETSFSFSTDLGCASQMHGNELISRCCAGTPRGTSRPPRPPMHLALWRACSIADHATDHTRALVMRSGRTPEPTIGGGDCLFQAITSEALRVVFFQRETTQSGEYLLAASRRRLREARLCAEADDGPSTRRVAVRKVAGCT